MLNKRAMIMIVDDDRINIEILASGFSSRHKILRCSDATQAFTQAMEKQPDVILLDVGMPVMNGYQVCRKLKEHEQTRNIPVVFSTGRDTEADEIEGFKVGAVDYITKPFRMELVKLRVAKVLELKRKTDLLEELANLDGLTNIANRRNFDHIFEQCWQHSIEQDESLSILMIDIDFFKQYNDHYGHASGDRCLVNIASLLDESCKRFGASPARYGGEEFIIVLPNHDSLLPIDFAEMIRTKVLELALPHQLSECSDRVTVSIGLASATGRSSADKQCLIEAADKHLYIAKQNGRNRIEQE